MVTASALSSPTPPPITDADIKKLSRTEIVATINHLGIIIADTKTENQKLQGLLQDASHSQSIALTAAGGALSKLVELTSKIQALGDHDKAMTDKVNALSKTLWWYRLRYWGAWIMLGLAVVAGIALFILFKSGRLAIAAAKL